MVPQTDVRVAFFTHLLSFNSSYAAITFTLHRHPLINLLKATFKPVFTRLPLLAAVYPHHPAPLPFTAGNASCVVALHNSGNMRLENITVVGDTNDCNVPLLQPRISFNCTMTRVLSQEDFDAGQVVLKATGASAFPRGPVNVLTSDSVSLDNATVYLNQSAGMDLSLKSDTGFAGSAVDPILVTITVGNTGSVTLRDVKVNVSHSLGNLSCGASGAQLTAAGDQVSLLRLNVSESVACTGNFLFSQDEFEAGPATLSVSGSAIAGNQTASATSQNIPLQPQSSPSLTVSIDNCSVPTAAGGNMSCQVTVHNGGNVRLDNVSVGLKDGSGLHACYFSEMQPWADNTCVVAREVSQQMFDDAAEQQGSQVVMEVVANAAPRGTNRSALVASGSQLKQLAVTRLLSLTGTANLTTVTAAGEATSVV